LKFKVVHLNAGCHVHQLAQLLLRRFRRRLASGIGQKPGCRLVDQHGLIGGIALGGQGQRRQPRVLRLLVERDANRIQVGDFQTISNERSIDRSLQSHNSIRRLCWPESRFRESCRLQAAGIRMRQARKVLYSPA